MAWNNARKTTGARATQSWNVGEVVAVGFVSNLRVVRKVPTPGDFAPDAYVLESNTNGRIYRFVPHHGLERCDSIEQAAA